MEIIDSHCHLFLEEFRDPPREPYAPAGADTAPPGEARLETVLERARRAGVEAVVNVALDVDSTLEVLEAHRRRPWLHPTAGWHPGRAGSLTAPDLDRLAALAAQDEVAAFGEIGLDYFRDPGAAPAQKRALAGLLEVAASVGKPVRIHCREAWDDLLAMLAPIRPRLAGVLFHCFSGTEAEVAKAAELDAHLSFAGPVTFPKAEALRRALAAAPRDRIMIETDAPYLAPAPFRGRVNEPAMLVHHIEAVAGVLGLEPAEAAALTAANARRFFSLPDPAAR
jgi:TatD DNase family protein